MIRTLLKILAVISIIVGLAICIFFVWGLNKEYTYLSDSPILMEKSGQVGDFIGGIVGTIFSLSGFFILYLTLSEQVNFSTKERFENKFFDLLKLHRENVRELESNKTNGRKTIDNIVKQFLACREDLKPFFLKKKVEDIYEERYLNWLKSNLKNTENSINLLSLAKINIPYLITFYGIAADGKQSIQSLLKNKYKEEFYQDILNYISLKPTKNSKYYQKWEKINRISRATKKIKICKIICEIRNNNKSSLNDPLYSLAKEVHYDSNYVKFYGGHQYQLGHYFRHLFQTYSFINEQSMRDDEQYFYAKTLRAQLSTPELVLFFVNSLSTLGLTWDLAPQIKKRYFLSYEITFLKEMDVSKKRLISKFNIIKNLPGEEIFGIKYRDFYPNVDYEFSFNDE